MPRGEPEVVEHARLLALKQPGRVALFPGVEPSRRAVARGAADAILLGDYHDRIGRAAGLALLYCTFRSPPRSGANRDYLVDYDAGSRTGHAILYSTAAPFEIESAVRRALTLRADGDVWTPLVKTLMTSAPRWSAAAAAISRGRGPVLAAVLTAYRLREARDADTELTVDIDDSAVRPNLAADPQRDLPSVRRPSASTAPGARPSSSSPAA